jgi:hypothetical protein
LPTAAAALPWFSCQHLRYADASTVRIHKQGRWAQVVVSPCGCGMSSGVRSATRGIGWAQGAIPDAGVGWERDEGHGMRCGHGGARIASRRPGASLILTNIIRLTLEHTLLINLF